MFPSRNQTLTLSCTLLTECAEPVVEGDDDQLSPGGQHVGRKQIGGAVGELAAVDVEQDCVLVSHVTGDLAAAPQRLSADNG